MLKLLWLLSGTGLAAIFILFARTKPTTERAVLAVGLVVAAFVYVAVAGLRHQGSWISLEMVGLAGYGLSALLGTYFSAWWLVLGWAAHPLWDVYFHLPNISPAAGATYVPEWYVWLCISFDLSVALYITSAKITDGQVNGRLRFASRSNRR